MLNKTSGIDKDTVSVAIDTKSMTSGLYQGTIIINAPGATNNPQSVNVSLTIRGIVPQAITSSATNVTTNSSTLNANVNPNGQMTDAWFEYGNDTITTSTTNKKTIGSGLTLQKVTETLNGLMNNKTYFYRVVAENNTGTTHGAIDSCFTSNNAIINLSVNKIDFTGISGGMPLESKSVTITNGGPGSLNWNATSNQTWIIVDPPGGSNGDQVSITVDISGFNAGPIKTGKVTIQSDDAIEGSKDITITLSITAKPRVRITSTGLVDFAAGKVDTALKSKTFDIINQQITSPYPSKLEWEITEPLGYFEFVPSFGEVKINSTQMVTIRWDPKKFPDGKNSTEIEISTPESETPYNTITLGYMKDTEPPTITHSPLEVEESGNSVKIDLQVSDKVSGVDSFYVLYRKPNEKWDFSKKRDILNNSATLPILTKEGMEYRIIAVDKLNNKIIWISPVTGLDYTSVKVKIKSGNLSSPAPTIAGIDVNGYKIFAIPYILLDKKASSVFKDFGLYKKEWRLLIPNGMVFEDGENALIEVGKGYFLITRESRSLNISGDATSLVTTSFTETGTILNAGWNLIGNPFDMDIKIMNLKILNSINYQIYEYDNGWKSNPTILKQWNGLAVYVPNQAILKYDLTPTTSFTKNSENEKYNSDKNEWKCNVIVKSGNIIDRENYFGMLENATEGRDKYDAVEPPMLFGGISGYFPHPEWDEIVKLFSNDIRSTLSNDGNEWKFIVNSQVNEKITLKFEFLQNVPKYYAKYLVDIDRNLNYDLSKQDEVTTSGGNGLRNFSIIIGKKNYIENKNITTQPKEFSLSQNYPNPFNPGTTIRYSIPIASNIKLVLYDLLGRAVEVLTNEKKEPGYYEVFINAKNYPSGVYFYKLEARGEKNFTEIKKLLLVK